MLLNTAMENFQTKKLAMNSTALTHATSSSLLWMIGNPTLFKINSGGYFLFDILYLIRNRKMNALHAMYIYHHIACLYYLSLNPNIFNWMNIMGIMELSNIPNYIVYYHLKKKNEKEIKIWKQLQLAIYPFLRIIIGGALAYNEIKHKYKRVQLYPVIPLYFFSILWSSSMFINKGKSK